MLLPRSSNGALFSLLNISVKVAPEKLQQQKDSKSKHTYTVCSEKSRCILYAPSTCNEYLVLKLRKILPWTSIPGQYIVPEKFSGTVFLARTIWFKQEATVFCKYVWTQSHIYHVDGHWLFALIAIWLLSVTAVFLVGGPVIC